MMISIIAALDQNRGIGKDNQLPWHLPADLRRFKRITLGHHLLLGRKTFQSIGKPLPGREMIVLSRDAEFQPEGCQVCSSLEQALLLAERAGEKELFVIGGGEIFREALPLADKLYLTVVHARTEADTHFPALTESDWTVICQQDFPEDGQNSLGHTFQILVRVV